jgi:hypothetical protein
MPDQTDLSPWMAMMKGAPSQQGAPSSGGGMDPQDVWNLLFPSQAPTQTNTNQGVGHQVLSFLNKNFNPFYEDPDVPKAPTPYQQQELTLNKLKFLNEMQTQARERSKDQATLQNQQATQTREGQEFLSRLLGGGWKDTAPELTGMNVQRGEVGQDSLGLPLTQTSLTPNFENPQNSLQVGNRLLAPPSTKPTGTVPVPSHSPIAKRFIEEGGGQVDENGMVNIHPDLLKYYGETADQAAKAKEKEEEAAQVEKDKAELSGWVNDYITNDKPNKDLFLRGIQSAKTPAQIESLRSSLGTYQTTSSEAARKRNKLDSEDIQQAAIEGQRIAKRKEDEAQADDVWTAMKQLGTPPDTLLRGFNADKRVNIISKWMKDGKQLPTWITPSAQKSVTEIDSTDAIAKDVLHLLETEKDSQGHPLKDSNEAWLATPDRIKYWVGKDPKLGDLINKTEVFKGISSGRIAKGAGIRTQEFVDMILPHTPDVKKDSGQLMYNKIKSIRGYLRQQRESEIRNGNKWGMVLGSGGENLGDETPSPEDKDRSNLINRMRGGRGQ